MKVILTLSTLILLTCLFSCDAEKKNPIEGAWQLLEGKWVSADTTMVYYPSVPSEKSMKVISKTHFATVTQDTVNALIAFNGGSYTLENDIYTEELDYFYWDSAIDGIGLKQSYIVKVVDDKLFLAPSSVDGKVLELGIFEEWKRLK